MKIFRPERYQQTIRLTFSKKIDGKTVKQAFTVVESTRKELDALIREVYADHLERGKEKTFDFVKLTVQVIKFETGKPRGKDEWSYRLYRCSPDIMNRLVNTIDNQKGIPAGISTGSMKEKTSCEKFDFSSLRPFDEVLVRVNGQWVCDLFQWFNPSDIHGSRFVVMCNGEVDELLPFAGFDDYLGTENETPARYKL